MWNSIKLGLILVMLGGCAVGVQHDYLDDTIDLGVATEKSVVVATLDHRAYILDRRKNEDFVGLSRGGFGNPFDVVTLSGNPLASDISMSIAMSLRKMGVDAEVLELESRLSVTDTTKNLVKSGAQRYVLLTLREWKGDAMINVGFLYDFDLNILDQSGNLLVKKHLLADENLGAADPFSPGGGEVIGPRFKSLMEYVFQDPEIQKHLM